MNKPPSLPDLVLAIGSPAFAGTLLAAAASAVDHDASALMVLHAAAPPSVLVDRLKPAERAYLYGDYLSGVYALSPFYQAAQHLKAPRVARISDIAPRGFAQSEYYRRYFSLIGVDDMVGLLIPAGGGDTAFLSLSRSTGRPRFSTASVKVLASSMDVLAAAITRHIQIAGPLAGRRPHPAPEASRDRAAASGLTRREAEVVNLILQGHSARAVGEVLKISGETVRVHRRNIYDKLGVSSQAELFRWFLAERP